MCLTFIIGTENPKQSIECILLSVTGKQVHLSSNMALCFLNHELPQRECWPILLAW